MSFANPSAAFYSTVAFAPQDQRLFTSSAATQWSDVFARLDRRPSIEIPEPRRRAVRLLVGGGAIEFTYTSFDAGMPRWAPAVLRDLEERWGAQPGWDSYQARPTDPDLVARLLNIFSDLMRDGYAIPTITPLADGGVQAEWHNLGEDLEIVVPADGDPTYYYFNQATGDEEEGDLDPSYAHVQDLIGRVS